MASNLNRRRLLTGSAAMAGGLLTYPSWAASSGPGGFSANGLSKVKNTLQPFVDQGEAVGLVTLLYRRGEIAQVNTLGWQNREEKIPMERDTIFRMASMTKPMTSAAVLMLMEEGRLALTDEVRKWLPELSDPKVLRVPDGPVDDTVPASRQITVLDLLTHRSGISYNFTSAGPLAKAISSKLGSAIGTVMTSDEWIKSLGELPLMFDPGARWHYGLSTDVLGVLVERVSGMSFAEFLRTRLWDPLGMKDTAFYVPKDKQNRLAVVYDWDKSGNRIPLPSKTSSSQPKFSSGGGGSLSTADDYLQFGRMLLGLGKVGDTRILSRRTVRLMTANWLTPAQRQIPFFGLDFWGGQGFGLGVSVVDNVARHASFGIASKGTFSWAGAYGTNWQGDPQEDMVAVYLVQQAAKLGDPDPEQPVRMPTGPSSSQAFLATTYRAIDI